MDVITVSGPFFEISRSNCPSAHHNKKFGLRCKTANRNLEYIKFIHEFHTPISSEVLLKAASYSHRPEQQLIKIQITKVKRCIERITGPLGSFALYRAKP